MRGSQWAFTLLFTESRIGCLSSIAEEAEEIVYMIFGVIASDSGRYIRGYIKTADRMRVGVLIKIIGNGAFSILRTKGAITEFLKYPRVEQRCSRIWR